MRVGSSNPKRGSVVAGALILAIIGAAVMASNLKMAFSEYKLAQRTLHYQSAMNLAEAGLEEGLNSINTESWPSWTVLALSDYYRVFSNINMSGNRTTLTTVYVQNPYSQTPIMCAEGRIIDAHGTEIYRQIRVDLERASLFYNGLQAKESIHFGSAASVDAYDSDVGPWNASTNRLDTVTVATADPTPNAIDIGNASIWGYLATGGGAFTYGPSGSLQGEDSTTSPIDFDRAAYNFVADMPDVTVPTGTVEGVNYIVDYTTQPTGDFGIGGTDSNPVVYHLDKFDLKKSINALGPAVFIVDNQFEMSGSGKITIAPNASLEIYLGGNMDMGGNSVINGPLAPENLKIWGTAPTGTSQSFTFQGGVDTAGIIYAPNANVSYGGNATLSGSMVANSITFTGSSSFHYDIRLQEVGGGDYTLTRWRELRGTEELDFTDAMAFPSLVNPL